MGSEVVTQHVETVCVEVSECAAVRYHSDVPVTSWVGMDSIWRGRERAAIPDAGVHFVARDVPVCVQNVEWV